MQINKIFNPVTCIQEEYDKYIGKQIIILTVGAYREYYYRANNTEVWTKDREQADRFIVPSSYCLLDFLEINLEVCPCVYFEVVDEII